MAGLGPAIHEMHQGPSSFSWMPGPRPGTNEARIRGNDNALSGR